MPITLETTEAGRGIVPVELSQLRGDVPPAPPAPSSPHAASVPPEEGQQQPVPPDPDAHDADEDVDTDEEVDESPEVKKGSRAWRRRRNTVLERNALREEVAQLRTQMAQLQQAAVAGAGQQPSQPQQPQPPATQRPRYEDFQGNNEAYWEALTEWKANQRIQTALQEERARQADYARAEVNRLVQERILDGQTAYEDFDAALHVLPRFLPSDLFPLLENVVIQEEQGGALLYYLGKHPTVLQELARYRPGPGAVQFLQNVVKRLSGAPVPNGRTGASPGPTPTPQPPAFPPATIPPVRPLTGNGLVPPTGESPAEVASRGGTLQEYEDAKKRWAEQGRRY